jgi:subtilisin family serine protease
VNIFNRFLPLYLSAAAAVIATLVVDAAPTEPVPTLQEAFLVKLKQPLRSSQQMHPEIGRAKSTIQRDGLTIERWFASPDGLLLRARAARYLDRPTKEAILRRLNGLDGVELATTTSASAGQMQPSLFANAFASDNQIPEARLRGFREFDKTAHEARIRPEAPRAKGVLFVQTKEEALFGPAAAQTRLVAAADHARLGNRVAKVHKDSGTERAEIVEFDEDEVSLMEMIRRYHALSWVEYAEPQYFVSPMHAGSHDPISDPLTNGPSGDHLRRIQATKAWEIKHDTAQIVAVIDSGLLTTHSDFGGEWPDGNRFSNLSGTSIAGSSTSDDTGHGTHVAGIIGALGNNGTGSAGIAWRCQLLPYKVSSGGFLRTGADTDVALAIDRAVEKGAGIINMSFGLNAYGEKVAAAVKGNPATNSNGQTVMVAVPGNGGHFCFDPPPPGGGDDTDPQPTPTPAEFSHESSGPGNLDTAPVYPASLPYPNLVAVANSDANDELYCKASAQDPGGSSSYGPFTVDLAAPGTNIISTISTSNNAYAYMTGTSMAAPHVSGTLALIRQTYPHSTAWELLDRVRMGVDVNPSLSGLSPSPTPGPTPLRDFKGVVSTGGRLNVYRALLPRSKMANVSSRAKVETGDGIVINGFILRAATRVLVRGIGPSLANAGVTAPLGNPYLKLINLHGTTVAENNDWRDTQQAAIAATGIPPSDDLESAIVMDLGAGAYTAQVSGLHGGQGEALVEVYELTEIADPLNRGPNWEEDWRQRDMQRTQNFSSRTMIRGNEQTLILGLIVTGKGVSASDTPPAARRVLIRALGRSLVGPGLSESDVLADPQLELFTSVSDGNGNTTHTLLAQNNNWKDADTSTLGVYQQKVREAGFEPGSDLESIIIATLTPGAYTIHCRAADGGQGIASVEIYEY